MLPFKETLISDQNKQPLDSITYYSPKIVKNYTVWEQTLKLGR